VADAKGVVNPGPEVCVTHAETSLMQTLTIGSFTAEYGRDVVHRQTDHSVFLSYGKITNAGRVIEGHGTD